MKLVRREANQLAHFLAKQALEVHCEIVWKEECPSSIHDLVHVELM
jgi:hypothetical protein